MTLSPKYYAVFLPVLVSRLLIIVMSDPTRRAYGEGLIPGFGLRGYSEVWQRRHRQECEAIGHISSGFFFFFLFIESWILTGGIMLPTFRVGFSLSALSESTPTDILRRVSWEIPNPVKLTTSTSCQSDTQTHQLYSGTFYPQRLVAISGCKVHLVNL